MRAQRDVHGVRLHLVGRPRHVRNRLKARGADVGLALVLWSRDHETGRYFRDVALDDLLGVHGVVRGAVLPESYSFARAQVGRDNIIVDISG